MLTRITKGEQIEPVQNLLVAELKDINITIKHLTGLRKSFSGPANEAPVLLTQNPFQQVTASEVSVSNVSFNEHESKTPMRGIPFIIKFKKSVD